MRRSLDPHRNLFFYYAGSSRIVDGRERQLEDNSTKALINLLELSTRQDPQHWLLDRFLTFSGCPEREDAWANFALQRRTIGERALERVDDRILLGIAPIAGAELDTELSAAERGSRPDAWIWTATRAVCIETKVVGKLDKGQLERHLETLAGGARFEERTWKQIYAFFAEALADSRKRSALSMTTVLLEEFIEYLRIIAYRQEIDMGEFDGFRPEHFSAFTFLDDDEAEDTRRNVKHYLGQFVAAVHEKSSATAAEFRCRKVGNIRLGSDHAWATLSRTESPVQEPHFSFSIGGDSVAVKLLIEGTRPTRNAKKRIEADPQRFLELMRPLEGWELRINRRWEISVRRYKAELACKIMLDRFSENDVQYAIAKMNELAKPGGGQGYFTLAISHEFAPDDPRIRSKDFAETAAKDLELLLPLERFLSQ